MKLFNKFAILKNNLRDIDYLTRKKLNFGKKNVSKIQLKINA